MSTEAGVTVEEYLHTSFPDLDMEYCDGELVERSPPDLLHSKTQLLILAFFLALRKTKQVFPYPELRLKLRERLYRIPDVSVFHPAEPTVRVPDTPPFIANEVLSDEDRLSRVRAKLEEYRAWGVPHVWLVHSHSKRLYTCEAGLKEVEVLRVPELGIEATPADLFE